jgi:hypothetical protein
VAQFQSVPAVYIEERRHPYLPGATRDGRAPFVQ